MFISLCTVEKFWALFSFQISPTNVENATYLKTHIEVYSSNLINVIFEGLKLAEQQEIQVFRLLMTYVGRAANSLKIKLCRCRCTSVIYQSHFLKNLMPHLWTFLHCTTKFANRLKLPFSWFENQNAALYLKLVTSGPGYYKYWLQKKVLQQSAT